MFWEVEADLFRTTGKAAANELYSPYLQVDGRKYRMVLKFGEGEHSASMIDCTGPVCVQHPNVLLHPALRWSSGSQMHLCVSLHIGTSPFIGRLRISTRQHYRPNSKYDVLSVIYPSHG